MPLTSIKTKSEKPSWSEAPNWARVLLLSKMSTKYFWAESHSIGSMIRSSSSDITGTFSIGLDFIDDFKLVDTFVDAVADSRTRTKRPSWSEAPTWAGVLLLCKLNDAYYWAEGYSAGSMIQSITAGELTFRLKRGCLGDFMLVNTFVSDEVKPAQPENSGGSCNYYQAPISKPTTATQEYTAECNDIIECLNMTYAEANIFKEIWRGAAARTLGLKKEGNTTKRGAEKILFFAKRIAVQNGVK